MKKQYVYVVKHSLDEIRKAVLEIFSTEEKAITYCEGHARSTYKDPMPYKWNSDKTTYYMEQYKDNHYYEVKKWEVR